jgi:hypothetical protein
LLSRSQLAGPKKGTGRSFAAGSRCQSNHATTGGAAATVLVAWFGDNTTFSITSEALPGVTRSFNSFSQATDELNDARVFGGIHFRTAVNVGRALGVQVAQYVLENSLQRTHGASGSKGENEAE